jgi:hypothetical protein
VCVSVGMYVCGARFKHTYVCLSLHVCVRRSLQAHVCVSRSACMCAALAVSVSMYAPWQDTRPAHILTGTHKTIHTCKLRYIQHMRAYMHTRKFLLLITHTHTYTHNCTYRHSLSTHTVINTQACKHTEYIKSHGMKMHSIPYSERRNSITMTCYAQKPSVLPQLPKHNDVADYDAGKVLFACNGLQKASSRACRKAFLFCVAECSGRGALVTVFSFLVLGPNIPKILAYMKKPNIATKTGTTKRCQVYSHTCPGHGCPCICCLCASVIQ